MSTLWIQEDLLTIVLATRLSLVSCIYYATHCEIIFYENNTTFHFFGQISSTV